MRDITKFGLNRRRLLFGTDVLLDAVERTRLESKEARLVLRRCSGGEDLGFVTPLSLRDVYYIIGRQHGVRQARGVVRRLLDLVMVVPLGPEECDVSLASDEPDFEDGLVRACAELNEIDFILTRDKRAFSRSTVRSLTCREYLDICSD